MTIDEAIEEQEKFPEIGLFAFGPISYKATRLGIEALKREKECREGEEEFDLVKLPGETK